MNKQTGLSTDTQTDTPIYRHTPRQMDKQTLQKTDKTGKYNYIGNTQMNKQLYRQMERKTNRHTAR